VNPSAERPNVKAVCQPRLCAERARPLPVPVPAGADDDEDAVEVLLTSLEEVTLGVPRAASVTWAVLVVAGAEVAEVPLTSWPTPQGIASPSGWVL